MDQKSIKIVYSTKMTRIFWNNKYGKFTSVLEQKRGSFVGHQRTRKLTQTLGMLTIVLRVEAKERHFFFHFVQKLKSEQNTALTIVCLEIQVHFLNSDLRPLY